jgi:hypothetical protein
MPSLDEIIAVPPLVWGIEIGHYIAENPHPLVRKCVVDTMPGNASKYRYRIFFKNGQFESVENFDTIEGALSVCDYCYRESLALLSKALPEPTMEAEFDAEINATVVTKIGSREQAIRDFFAGFGRLTTKEIALVVRLCANK